MDRGKVPKLSVFSGHENLPKHDASYEQWIFEIRSIQHTYSESQIKEAILRSGKDAAASVIHSLVCNAAVSKILEKVGTVYGNVTSSHVLLQDFYRLVQSKNENCQVFATRLGESLSKISSRFLYMVRKGDAERHLHDHLFYGMVKGLRNSIRYFIS